MVSVIIPTIGRSTLQRALDSVWNQTYKDLEIIVVFDGPQDVRIIEGVKTLVLPQRSGFHAKPRNEGIQSSNGKYICYLDDDDEFTPDHVEVLVNAIGESDFAYGMRQYMNENGVYMQSSYFNWDKDRACDPFWLGTCDILHTRKIIYKLGGWNESLKRFGDFELGCRLGRLPASGVGVNRIITNCYNGGGQITVDPDRQDIDPADLSKTKIIQTWLKH
jgi:glycosyltransferase involved in cell wall biosynthesis